MEPILTQPGAYPNVPAELYHRAPNLLPEPSLSSSGAKKLLTTSPLHYWHDSPMNPDRPAEAEAPHFAIGKAAHDLVLLPDRFAEQYHVLPEGFSRAKTKAMADAIAEADAAQADGKTLLSASDLETVEQVAAAIRANPTAMAALTNGVAEETLVWRDPLTGCWLRARPDFRPRSIEIPGSRVRVVADLKFMAPTYCSPAGFARAIENNGYHQSAAFYCDGLKAVFGQYPTHWLHIVVEKEAPYSVSLYELPGEDIERGRMLNRQAVEIFERCLKRGTTRECWPGYADTPAPVGLPVWARRRIDDAAEATDISAWGAAA